MFCQAALRARAARAARLEARASRWEEAARAHYAAMMLQDDPGLFAAIEGSPSRR